MDFVLPEGLVLARPLSLKMESGCTLGCIAITPRASHLPYAGDFSFVRMREGRRV